MIPVDAFIDLINNILLYLLYLDNLKMILLLLYPINLQKDDLNVDFIVGFLEGVDINLTLFILFILFIFK